jgi:hypothetical protein
VANVVDTSTAMGMTFTMNMYGAGNAGIDTYNFETNVATNDIIEFYMLF